MSKLVISALIALTMIFGPLAALAAELKDGLGIFPILMCSAEGKRLLESIKKKAEELGPPPLENKRQELLRDAKELEKQAAVMKLDDVNDIKQKTAELKKKGEEFKKQLDDFNKLSAQIIEQVNEFLIEWKSKGLPELLQRSSSSQLSDLRIKLEKAILKVDLKAKQLKDIADADARQAKNPAGTLTIAHLIDQRKTILMVILGSVKQAAAQKAAGG